MVISESAAIQLYLADKYGDRFPGGGLIPDTPEERGRMYHWLFFLMTEIEAPLWRVALHSFLYAEDEKSEGEIELGERDGRSAERRGGKEGVSTCWIRWVPVSEKKHNTKDGRHMIILRKIETRTK